jgi:hypothetical protein
MFFRIVGINQRVYRRQKNRNIIINSRNSLYQTYLRQETIFQQRSARAEILEFTRPARRQFAPTSKFVFKYITSTQTKPGFILLQTDESPINLQSALTIVSIVHVYFKA